MIPRREELVEVTPPASPRTSTTSYRSSVSEYLHEHDFLSSPIRSPASEVSDWDVDGPRARLSARLRHAVGIVLLLATVFLWTASNFLASVLIPPSSPFVSRDVEREKERERERERELT
jgi:solute carrier family 35 protein F5